MTRNCKCGGRNVPSAGSRFFAYFRCDKCGTRRKQKKRQPVIVSNEGFDRNFNIEDYVRV